MNGSDLPLFSDGTAREVLSGICAQHNITFSLLQDLVDIQRKNLGRERQTGITLEFNAALAEFIEDQA